MNKQIKKDSQGQANNLVGIIYKRCMFLIKKTFTFLDFFAGIVWVQAEKALGFFWKYVKILTARARVFALILARLTLLYTKRIYKALHHHLAYRPHVHLSNKYQKYNAWHEWDKHKIVHLAVFVCYAIIVGAFVISSYQRVLALSDLFNNWNFSSPGDYTLDSGVETSGSSVRLKAQNYITDGDTKALYHLDETSGTNASDSSGSGNDATVNGGSFAAGNLNNGLALNGSSGLAVAPDTPSLSLSQTNTLEAWTKFSSNFNAGSHEHKQGVIDKGSYKLYYDQETGKVTYELANNSANTWTQQAGNDIKGSWDLNGKPIINDQVIIAGNLYVGLGNAVGDAEVWKWDGSTWTMVGGDGKNSSWPDQTYENVKSLAANGNTLYAGLGSTVGDGEVWSCNTATGCTTWTKIGGDGINSSWPVNVYEEVSSMVTVGGNLYAGLGLSAGDGEVWSCNTATGCTTWTKIGGDGINSGWGSEIEAVYSLTTDGSKIYAGLGNTTGDADLYSWNGSAWTKIGGDGINSGWAASTYEYVFSLRYFGGNLYAGLGATAGDAEVWRWNGSTWTQIGGDTLNSSWDATSYEMVYSLTDDGTNLYAGLGNTAGDNEVWRWNGSAWTKIGGDGVNGSFTNTHTIVQTLVYGNGKLYAGISAASNNAEVWSWDGSTWTRFGGGYINKSWGYFNLQDVETMTVSGDYLYAGTGYTVAGNAQVWRFDGNSWEIVGGQGLNGSWSPSTYENVLSMISVGGNLYVGLGTTVNDGEVWRWDGSSWTQIGGDGLNSGWGASYEEVSSLATYGGYLYAGLGNSANDAEVWRWNGSAWTKIGGDSINGGWTTNYERVSSMAIYNGQLYAGLGVTAGDAEVWSWNGSTWTKVGGDGVNSSWNLVYEQVESMIAYNGKLYAGLGNSTGDAEVWQYDGSSWSQIGGDGVNSSWFDGQFEQVKTMTVYNGKLYAGLGNSAGDGEVWEYSDGAWTKVGGGGTNSSWAANVIETVQSFSVYKGKLYAGLGNTANADASVWSYGNNGFLQSTTTSQDTNWHHIAATYDGITMKLYIDGSLNAQTSASLSMPDSAEPLLLGSTFGASEAGWSQGYFEGSIDEVRISSVARNAFTSKPYKSTAQTVTLNTPVRTSGVWHWDDLTSSETLNGGSITYRISDNGGTTWKYWDGSSWATSGNNTEANSISVISAHIGSFPVTFDGIKWQAILKGDGTQQVQLNTVGLTATSDLTEPTTNAANIVGFKAYSGSALANNAWTNGSSPYFSWDAGVDTDSGIKGYCLYLGTDNTADPVTTKGVLGVSPVSTGGHCQFIVAPSNIDTAVSGYIASPLASSNNPYYLNIKAIDNAGNVASSTTQFQFRFDNTPPSNPTYITAPSGFINTKDVTLTWPTTGGDAPADANSGVAGLQYRINGTSWYGDLHTGLGDINDLLTNDGAYTTAVSPDYTNLNDGINTVYFRTWDQAGNVTSSYVTAAVKLNTSGAPSEPQNLIVSPVTNNTNAFSFSWQAPNTFVGDANNITYCYTINSLPSVSNCTFTGAGVTSLGSGPYATQPGQNTLYLVAKDESGNINYASYASINFTANTPSPGMPTNTDLVDVSIKTTSNWRLALTWDQPSYVGAGIASYKVYRSTDNISFSFVGSSSSTTYIDAGLSQQRYYYRVAACDSTNNCGAYGTVVSGIPTGKFTSPAILVSDPVVSNITTKKATIRWSTDRSSDSKIAFGTSSGNYSPSEVSISNQTSSHQIELTNLSAGTTYYFVAKWTDEDGNTGVSQEYTFRTAPAPTLKEISATQIGLSNATIGFTSKDATKIDIFYGKSEGFGGVKSINTSPYESTYAVDIVGLEDGSKYFYKLVAHDSENNTYDGSVASFTTPARPRISDLRFQPITGEPTSTQEVTWNTNVPSTSMVTYGKVGSVGVDVLDSGSVTQHKIILRNLEDDSQYFLVAQSRDSGGNLAISDRQEFKTALDTRPPKISDIIIETSIRGTGAEARGQVVVSWKTDEPATSQVGYGEGSDVKTFNNKTSEDEALGTEHIVIVSDLPTSKVYSIQPLSKDKSGNQGVGDSQSAIIGRASDSVLTIILNALQKVFGY